MTILEFLQTHTLEEILQNDKMVKKLDPIERTLNECRDVDCDLSDFCGLLECSICMECECEFYTEHDYDYETNTYHWGCNITHQTNAKNVRDGINGDLKPVKCPHLEKHKEYIRNYVKDRLLREIED